jgi:nicotinate-nucleotide--dimethylbenzimidazole phosphoribosyltransferase
MSLLDTTIAAIGPLNAAAQDAARARQDQLTKPQGALGRLEALSIQLAGVTGMLRPPLTERAVIVMAGDHGVARQGVSAFPSDVTPQMVLNFLAGGAAVNVLARQMGARVRVVDIGVASPLPTHPELLARRVANGTEDFTLGPAMTPAQTRLAVETGIEVVTAEHARGLHLVATGEMGIGNTTPSAALVCAFTGAAADVATGRGTGIDDDAWKRKVAVVQRGLDLHRPDPQNGLATLAALGGYEIAGLAGVILGAAALRVPVVIDGFISTAAALVAVAMAPQAREYLIASHRSAEQGHAIALRHLGLHPLLDADLRLGEGTGALLAFPLVEAAVRTLNEMATFSEAGVSGPADPNEPGPAA